MKDIDRDWECPYCHCLFNSQGKGGHLYGVHGIRANTSSYTEFVPVNIEHVPKEVSKEVFNRVYDEAKRHDIRHLLQHVFKKDQMPVLTLIRGNRYTTITDFSKLIGRWEGKNVWFPNEKEGYEFIGYFHNVIDLDYWWEQNGQRNHAQTVRSVYKEGDGFYVFERM